jgi:hypothetical protein
VEGHHQREEAAVSGNWKEEAGVEGRRQKVEEAGAEGRRQKVEEAGVWVVKSRLRREDVAEAWAGMQMTILEL